MQIIFYVTESDEKLPQITSEFFARVNATFKRGEFAKKPIPHVRVVANTMMSFSWPWYESIVLMGMSYCDKDFDALK